eukprot:s119_g78.t1
MVLSAQQKTTISGFLTKAKDGQLGQQMQLLLQYLLSERLALQQRVHCSLIGVHQDNRDGLGVDAMFKHLQALPMLLALWSHHGAPMLRWKFRPVQLAMHAAGSMNSL